MTLSPTQSSGGDRGTVSSRDSPAIQELEDRLREQTALNAELDSEVRYLLQELSVRKEFIAQLEVELQSIHNLAGQQLEAVAEYSAYRSRISHRVVDRLVGEVHRHPSLYRPLRRIGRMVMTLATHSSTQTDSSSEPSGDAGDRDTGIAQLDESQ